MRKFICPFLDIPFREIDTRTGKFCRFFKARLSLIIIYKFAINSTEFDLTALGLELLGMCKFVCSLLDIPFREIDTRTGKFYTFLEISYIFNYSISLIDIVIELKEGLTHRKIKYLKQRKRVDSMM